MRASLCLLILTPVCLVQTNGSAAENAHAYVLSNLASTGSKRFSEADITRASGLRVGARITVADLQEAGDRLSQTGAFAQVAYKFDGETAVFSVTDATQFVPTRFDNFVWFTDADLIKQLHDSVPLFSGTLPLTGNLTERVSAALDKIIKAKSVLGAVVADLDPASGPPDSVRFHIEGVKVTLAEVTFPGASASQLPALQQVSKAFLAVAYSQQDTPGAIERQANALYGKNGYLKAQFGETKISLVKDDPASPSVALELPVQEGPRFTLGETDWRGNSAVSTAELMKVTSCKPGAVADTSCLAAAIAGAQQLYTSRGYMYAHVKSTATLDTQACTATFHLTADEGPIYHMGKVEFLALPEEQAQLVRRLWEMREGDVYDANYARIFLLKHVKANLSLSGWEAQYVQTIHDDTQVVDLSLKFQRMR